MNELLSLDDATRLLCLDQDLRREADCFLEASGLGQVIAATGYVPVGSYTMRTMVWRDLDFERTAEEPDWDDHWAVGQALAATGWPWRMVCVNAYRDPRNPGDHGFYWGYARAIRREDRHGNSISGQRVHTNTPWLNIALSGKMPSLMKHGYRYYR